MKKLMLGLFVLAFIFNFNLVSAQERTTTTTTAPTAAEPASTETESFFTKVRKALVRVFTAEPAATTGETTTKEGTFNVTDTVTRTETTTSATGTSSTKATGTTVATTDTKLPTFTGNCQNKQEEIVKVIEGSRLSDLRKVSAKRWLRLWYLQCLRGQSIDPAVYLKSFTTTAETRGTTR